jgi:hypothetical protein
MSVSSLSHYYRTCYWAFAFHSFHRERNSRVSCILFLSIFFLRRESSANDIRVSGDVTLFLGDDTLFLGVVTLVAGDGSIQIRIHNCIHVLSDDSIHIRNDQSFSLRTMGFRLPFLHRERDP